MNIKDQIKQILNRFSIGDYDYVLIKLKQLSKKNPYNSYLKNLLGSTYLKVNDIESAMINFKLSLQLDPKNVAAINNLANTYKNSNNYQEAERLYLKALEFNPNYVSGLLNYSNLKINLNNVDEAIDLLQKAITIEPDNYMLHFSLGVAYQSIGKFKETKKHAEKTLEINPLFSPADKLISSYIKYTDDNQHFIKMKKDINNQAINDNNKVHIHFALGKAFEDIGINDEAIYHIEKGNNLKRSLIKYDINDDINLMKRIKLMFRDVDFRKNNFVINNEKMIFVLGMPRSGTSLVEQILSSHSNVFGAGELPFLRNIILNNFKENQNQPKDILHTVSNLEIMSKAYIDKTSLLENNNKLILDKSPLNFLWIGFIKALFPNAKIIHVDRDPKDTCFSCYKNLFANSLNFTYQKKELALFYNAYSDLINFWNEKLHSFIYSIKYEDLINDPNKNIKNLLKFCELDFEEECLKFYENESPIKTMSATQARQKIYKTSIKSYKKYEKKLTDLFNNLA
jgi:tetratricopeptide (TPR) repeat protein